MLNSAAAKLTAPLNLARAVLVVLTLSFGLECEAADPAPAIAAMNPAPANKLAGYAGYELKPVAFEGDITKQKNADKVLAKLEENMQISVAPVIKGWNEQAASASHKDKLLIEPRITSVHKPSGATRFFAGAFAGKGVIMMKVKITEAGSGKLIGEPEFYRHANAMGGAWSMGATDNAMLQKIAALIANYLTANYNEAVGAPTGFE